MAAQSPHEITRLLQAWGDGDKRALEALIPLVYDELHRTAHRYMAREAPLLLAVGRAREASNDLTEGERVYFTPSVVLFALERGRVSEKLGDWPRAVRSYRYVVETWVHPDSSLEPYVTEAHEALTRLARAGKP